MSFKTISKISIALYIILFVVLMLFSNGTAYIIAGFLYVIIAFLATTQIEKEHRARFFSAVGFFLLFYALFSVVAHYVFIDNPFSDSYINIDESKFFNEAVLLSKYSYFDIWQTAFSEFQYNGTPIFWAWVGTLQKMAGLGPFYGYLFLKLNVAFLGSFIPGIVYLLSRKVTDEKSAFKAAIVYGLFSFTLFYSVGLMRDIHTALIYGMALYIIIYNKYSLKSYVLLLVLGITAYFIRLENGLFFLAFLGVWLLKSKSRSKPLMALGAVALMATIIWLGGVDMIYNMATGTTQNYSERAVTMAESGSLGVQLMNLPMPINHIGVFAFGQIAPFPFWVPLEQGNPMFKNIFYLPLAIAALFWFMVWMRIIRFPKKAIKFAKKYKFVVIIALLYILMVSMGQAAPRRLMAVYPVIFMGYVFIDNKSFRLKEFIFDASIYFFLLMLYFVLKT